MLKFLYFNLSAGEFSKLSGVSTDSLRDWRKRGIGPFLCQPHPSENGTWVYSQRSATVVFLAGLMYPVTNDLKDAMYIANKIVEFLVGRRLHHTHLNKGGYDSRFVSFVDGVKGANPKMCCGANLEEMFSDISLPFQFPVAHVFDLDMIERDFLSAQHKAGLNSSMAVG